MNLNELIRRLEDIKNQYGDVPCVVSIDTPNAFNETKLLDVNILTYELHYTEDSKVDGFQVALHGELPAIEVD